MPTVTIRPTAHTVAAGGATDAAKAYNGNLADWCVQTSPVGGVAQLNLQTFEADPQPGRRTAVLLNVAGGFSDTDPYDPHRVYFRKASDDPWTLLLSHNYPDVWGAPPSSVATVQVDVTNLAGNYPASEWQVAVFVADLTPADDDGEYDVME